MAICYKGTLAANIFVGWYIGLLVVNFGSFTIFIYHFSAVNQINNKQSISMHKTIKNNWKWCDVNLWKILNIVYFIKYEQLKNKLLGKCSFKQKLVIVNVIYLSNIVSGLRVMQLRRKLESQIITTRARVVLFICDSRLQVVRCVLHRSQLRRAPQLLSSRGAMR
jgi:hypothetical protein